MDDETTLLDSADPFEPRLIAVMQVAAILGVGRSTVYQLITPGELKPVHIGRNVRFRASDVSAYIDRLT